MHTSRIARLAGAATAGLLVTAGCNGGDPEPADPDPTPVTSPEPTPAPPAESPEPMPTPDETTTPADEAEGQEPSFPEDTSSDTADPSDGARLSPVDIRVGVHDGFDRVVVDLEGEGVPGWLVQYDDDPRTAGRGDAVDVAGDYYLTLHVRGVMYPTEEDGTDYRGDDRIQGGADGVIQEVLYGTIFEGQADIYIGLSAEQPFRVFLLEEPTRLVVDVEHP